jgi:hypothetical protein
MRCEQAVPTAAVRRACAWGGALAVALAALAAPPATAGVEGPNPFGNGSGAPWVFQSGHGAVDDGPGFDHYTRTLPLGTTTLHLYVTAGPSTTGVEGDVCLPNDEPGDEICGFDVQLNLSGAGHFAGFRPAGPPGGTGLVSSPTSFDAVTKSLRMNGVHATSPIPAGATKLGELDVAVEGNGVTVTVSGNAMVIAGERTVDVLPNVLAVPEPGEAWLLGSALAGLAALARLRRPRAG